MLQHLPLTLPINNHLLEFRYVTLIGYLSRFVLIKAYVFAYMFFIPTICLTLLLSYCYLFIYY